MGNKKLGNQFEAEFCEILAEEGFWTHNLAQNSDGQPADVIAVKNGQAYLIDCKVCSRGKFAFDRIEANQILSMDLWRECGNGPGWFALEFPGQVYMVSLPALYAGMGTRASMTEELAGRYGVTLADWLECRR